MHDHRLDQKCECSCEFSVSFLNAYIEILKGVKRVNNDIMYCVLFNTKNEEIVCVTTQLFQLLHDM